eukprot:155341_1
MALVLALFISLVAGHRKFKATTSDGQFIKMSDLGPSRHHSLLHTHFNPSINELNSLSSSTQHAVTISADNQITAANNSIPVIYVTNYGADPTGRTDSTSAFQKAISTA